MSNDSISRCELFNRLATIPAPPEANEFKAKIYAVIQGMETAGRPQGKWFKDDEGTFICSACGTGDKDQPTLMGKPMFEWCPFCGAQMKGAANECL